MDITQYPSVTATRPHHKVSGKYRFIPTTEVLDLLRERGWEPSEIQEQRTTRMSDNKGFQKHLVRLRHPDFPVIKEFGRLVPEIVVQNAHNTSSAFLFGLGIKRLACLNGMMVADSLADFRVRHIGYTADKIFEAVKNLAKAIPSTMDTVKLWNSIELTRDEQGVFARSASQLRWEEGGPDESQLLRVNRYDDAPPTLWNTFNRVQENMIGAGVKKRRNSRQPGIRKITGIDQNTKLNKALWTLASEYAKLKG